ncbi:MAG TPA: hypothetical protein QF518_05835 [Nitrosopumilus sp.]|jgi:hypothetical protein|nr:hypothetical protein [Nitrososphaerota archaeon]MDP6327639.1 hypothetical protein [Nitrosopumilus sp.]HJM25612.1 hypothetical protein [Nitrosopumilus sp.]HJO32128.1 hypothetical protein [Nitrosopumilus sp.]|tara:strand:+ start:14810 stop:15118 length:309 start_codon:yes stop_codon:yes gene_type:complete
MVKSLGDYNIEQSSSTDVNNIKWSKKIQTENKPKIKKKKAISPTNIIPNQKTTKDDTTVEKIFKIEHKTNSEKIKNEKTDKKSQKSAASNCKIEPSFTRRGR